MIFKSVHLPEEALDVYLILLEVSPDSPPLIISQRVSVFLEQRVDAGNATVPRVLKIFQCQSPEKQTTNLKPS